MARMQWNSRGPNSDESPMVWGCTVFLREDGTFETEFTGETGYLMMKAAVDVLYSIRRLREEQAYDFGAGNPLPKKHELTHHTAGTKKRR